MSLPRHFYDRGNADTTIIASSPFVAGEMTIPHRAVLRDLGREYVVHTQCVPAEGQGNIFFHGGHYFPKRDAGALQAAFAKFVERSTRVVIQS